MDKTIASVVLKSLLERCDKSSSAVFLTTVEADAIRALLEVQGEEQTRAPTIASLPQDKFVAPLKVIFPDPETIDAEHLMCLDFGTSFSKAFACSTSIEEDVPELFSLTFGTTLQGEPQLLLPSELFIDNGKLYLGAAARARFESVGAPQDRLVDSPKQFITLNRDVSELTLQQLDEAKDPTRTLSKRDALVLYLAHLNVLSEKSLRDQGLSANLERRYAHPAWKPDFLEANRMEMRRIIAEAIALGRCFTDELVDSLPVARAKAIADGVRDTAEAELPYGLVGDPVLEATAAGAGALIGTPKGSRQPYVILDIGAGTTDVAGCRCIHDAIRNRIRVTEVEPARDAIAQAGNVIDNILLKLVLNKCSLAEKTSEYDQVQASLKRNIRSNKEILFNDEALTVELVTGEVVEVELQELLARSDIQKIFEKITELVENAAFCVVGDDEKVKVAATGGGASLPVVKALDGKVFIRGSKSLRLELVDPMPEILQEPYAELRGPYAQIAVAVGGSLPELPVQARSTPRIVASPRPLEIRPSYKS